MYISFTAKVKISKRLFFQKTSESKREKKQTILSFNYPFSL